MMKRILAVLLCIATLSFGVLFTACTVDKGKGSDKTSTYDEDGEWTDNY